MQLFIDFLYVLLCPLKFDIYVAIAWVLLTPSYM